MSCLNNIGPQLRAIIVVVQADNNMIPDNIVFAANIVIADNTLSDWNNERGVLCTCAWSNLCGGAFPALNTCTWRNNKSELKIAGNTQHCAVLPLVLVMACLSNYSKGMYHCCPAQDQLKTKLHKSLTPRAKSWSNCVLRTTSKSGTLILSYWESMLYACMYSRAHNMSVRVNQIKNVLCNELWFRRLCDVLGCSVWTTWYTRCSIFCTCAVKHFPFLLTRKDQIYDIRGNVLS